MKPPLGYRISAKGPKEYTELAAQLASRKTARAPSLRVSLALLATTLTGVSSYSLYKVKYKKESFFLPLWISGYRRKPYRSELDKEEFLEHATKKLADRLGVDEVVNQIFGVPIKLEHFVAENGEIEKLQLSVRSSGPGITGLVVEPNWNYNLTSRPFSIWSASSGFDRLLFPFSDSSADSEDASDIQNQKRAYLDAVVEGKVKIISKAHQPPIAKEGILEFQMVQSLDHRNASPRFQKAFLIYKDESSGKDMKQRLW
jgi:hypothetical protein